MTGTPPKSSVHTGAPLHDTAYRWVVWAFPWHLRVVLVGNAALNMLNALTGKPWWAFWPLIATGFVLAVHYLLYKAATVDERWVRQRTEELNLKSYDRSHIESVKSRFESADNRSDDRS
jgi:hypothetical protein